MRNLGLISSLVNISRLPGHVPALHFPLFDRSADEDLDEQRLQRFFFAQDAPEALRGGRLSACVSKTMRAWRFAAQLEDTPERHVKVPVTLP